MSPTCRFKASSRRSPSEYTVQKYVIIRCVVQASISRWTWSMESTSGSDLTFWSLVSVSVFQFRLQVRVKKNLMPEKATRSEP